MMTHDEMIAVIAAHKEGKEIEVLNAYGRYVKWENAPAFNFQYQDYRIKPEPRKPRVIWVNEFSDGEIFIENYITEESATEKAQKLGLKTIQFIEVIDKE